MTGFDSKRAAAADKLDNDDLTIAYMSGYHDGKRAAQPAQEPVAWLHRYGCRANAFGKCDMGCTAPPQREWVGLTDIDIAMAFDGVPQAFNDKLKFGRAIEQYLKEKNT